MFFGTPCIYEKNISELQTVDYNQKDTELIDSVSDDFTYIYFWSF